MSTVQVDAINESTTNAGVTVDGVLIKDGTVDGVDVSGITSAGLVKLASQTVSSATASVIFDNFVDNSLYSLYKIYTHHLLPATDNTNFWGKFRSGGASGSDMTGTYHRAGTAMVADTSGSTVFGSQSSSNYAPLVPNNGANADESLIVEMTYRVSDGTNGITSIKSDTAFQNTDDNVKNQVVTHFLESTTAATGIKFQMESGNIASGTITVYGVLK
jgi:hypothetical protein